MPFPALRSRGSLPGAVAGVIIATSLSAWYTAPARSADGDAANTADEVQRVDTLDGGGGPPPEGRDGTSFLRAIRGLFGIPEAAEPDRFDPTAPAGADGPMPDDPEKAAIWQQRQQLRQHAAQLVQHFQPVLHAELELVRNACGDDALPAAPRKRLLAAGRAAVKQSAVEYARAQLIDGVEGVDPRRTIREAIGRAVKAHVAAEACAAYERQVALRAARRDRAARGRLVAVVHSQLELTPEQQRRITAELEEKWNANWPWAVSFQGVQINGHRPAPDFAGACITPHLDDRQRDAWQTWCQLSGVRVHGLETWGQGWEFDGRSALEPDAWWGQ